MRHLAFALASLLVACAEPTPAPSQCALDAAPHKAGAVVLVRTPRHLEAALETAEGMRADARFQPFRVLVCGDAVKALQAGSELEPRLVAAQNEGVRITACGMSLRELEVDARALTKAVDVVPNALAEALSLQAEGWVSVEL